MDLEEFRAFLGVVETGSFLAAATSLNMARATLRRRVEALEARAGVPLLERSARGVVVTEAGAVLAARGRHVLQEASALVASVREIGREPVGVLRVLMPMGLPPHALTPLFAALREAFPRLSLQLRFSEDPVHGALEDVDVLVHFGPEGPEGPWLSHEVWRLREWLLASSEYLERRGTPKTLEDLAGHELLAWAPPGEDPRVLPTLTGESIEVEPTLVSADVHCLRQMVLAGHGIGFVPDALLPDPGVPDGLVVPVLPELIGRQRGLHVVFPAAQAGLPKLRAILQHVRAFAERSAALRGG
ncbi:LysR family transcriptional regulator [Nannocystis sp. SCPEA4]|uniref:LysR family transcriptional regulator n=1 Tax=Nannocystis sp. SCPEA4 TaxID=2996787 RepID=UPI002271424C|nr:LysR family transcriptional regulator [Nannocystis sp. SCPEA4]MCY1056786.1 LysR family transcriptional regulator [Nannocystis sp. SCPEA4]